MQNNRSAHADASTDAQLNDILDYRARSPLQANLELPTDASANLMQLTLLFFQITTCALALLRDACRAACADAPKDVQKIFKPERANDWPVACPFYSKFFGDGFNHDFETRARL